MYQKTKDHMSENTTHVDTKEELIETLKNKDGFVTCYWYEDKEDETEIKELTSATIRCYPLDNEELNVNPDDLKANLDQTEAKNAI